MEDKSFEELKPKILKILNDKKVNFPGEAGLSLVEGFALVPIQDGYSKLRTDARSMPLVGVIGATTGAIYFIPLYSLIPKSELGVLDD